MQSQNNILALFQQLRGQSREAQEAAADSLIILAYQVGGPTAILRAGGDLSLLVARVNNGHTPTVRACALHTLTKLTVPDEVRGGRSLLLVQLHRPACGVAGPEVAAPSLTSTPPAAAATCRGGPLSWRPAPSLPGCRGCATAATKTCC